MATSQKRPLRFDQIDSWFEVVQWVYQRIWAFAFSAIGAGVMGALAKQTKWISQYGPIAWGLIGLAVFVGLYLLFAWGVRDAARQRWKRAEAAMVERLSEHGRVNPLDNVFKQQRILLADFFLPFMGATQRKTFIECDLIGPATIYLGQSVVFRANSPQNVEFIQVDQAKCGVYPNKISLHEGAIERCNIYNVIFLVDKGHASSFEASFTPPTIPWMN